MVIREGTKNNPINIKVARYFFVHCPKCETIIDCGEEEAKIKCSECGKEFYVWFNSMDCGL